MLQEEGLDCGEHSARTSFVLENTVFELFVKVEALFPRGKEAYSGVREHYGHDVLLCLEGNFFLDCTALHARVHSTHFVIHFISAVVTSVLVGNIFNQFEVLDSFKSFLLLPLLLLFPCLFTLLQKVKGVSFFLLLLFISASIKEVVFIAEPHHVIEFVDVIILNSVSLFSLDLLSSSSFWHALSRTAIRCCPWALVTSCLMLGWRLLSSNSLICTGFFKCVQVPIVVLIVLHLHAWSYTCLRSYRGCWFLMSIKVLLGCRWDLSWRVETPPVSWLLLFLVPVLIIRPLRFAFRLL